MLFESPSSTVSTINLVYVFQQLLVAVDSTGRVSFTTTTIPLYNPPIDHIFTGTISKKDMQKCPNKKFQNMFYSHPPVDI